MATITTSAYLDDASRIAGESFTINSGGSLTVRTDSQVHANAPASLTGSISSVTINEGNLVWDSRTVRIVPYSDGSGVVPAIGTSVTQGGVSGYFLGVWADWASAPVAAGSAMPATGFLKFREVAGGNFQAGALSGIGATAVSIDVQGWIMILHDSASTITVPRVGKHTVRGGRFHIGTTNGNVGQEMQTPSMGGAGVLAPGAFVEKTPGSLNTDDDYEWWPGIYNMSHTDIGDATGATDSRLNLCLAQQGGKLKFGQLVETTGVTYTSVTQSGTYAELSTSLLYVWLDDTVIFYVAAGHSLRDGQQVGVVFTSGGAVGNNAVYVVTVTSPYHFTIDLTGSGAGGNATMFAFLIVTMSGHYANTDDDVYCDFTSGTGVDGYYRAIYVSSTTFRIEYPRLSALTVGNVSFVTSMTLSTSWANTLRVGSRVKITFAENPELNGVYAFTYSSSGVARILVKHTGGLSGTCSLSRQIGNSPPSGCRVWIPSNILAECSTSARSIPIVANTTFVNRPEWTTTNGGAIDFEYLYGLSGHVLFNQAYSLKMFAVAAPDFISIESIATEFLVDLCGMGHTAESHTTAQYYGLSCRYCYQGGWFKRSKFSINKIPVYGGSAMYCAYDKSIKAQDIIGINLKDLRDSLGVVYVGSSEDVDFTDVQCINGTFQASSVLSSAFKQIDNLSRLNGWSNASSGYAYAVQVTSNSVDVLIDGVTIGKDGEIENVVPYTSIAAISGCSRIKLRNLGTALKPLKNTNFMKQTTGTGNILYSDGNTDGIEVKRAYIDITRNSPMETRNNDRNVLYSNIFVESYKRLLDNSVSIIIYASLTYKCKAFRAGIPYSTGYAAVYGTHFLDNFMGKLFGRYSLSFNEPTESTSPYFDIISGNIRFNSSGGCLMYSVGDQAIWTDPDFRLGHTGFDPDIAPIMTGGGTISNFQIDYQIDAGLGFSDWKTLSNSDLSSETVSPSIGFRMKIRITTLIANTTPITYLAITTTTTETAQQTLYPLDTIALTIPGLVPGSDVVVYNASDGSVIGSVDAYSGTSWDFVYETPGTVVDIGIFKAGFIPRYIRGYILPSDNATLPNVAQIPDRNYA